jgi:hypothetical protein
LTGLIVRRQDQLYTLPPLKPGGKRQQFSYGFARWEQNRQERLNVGTFARFYLQGKEWMDDGGWMTGDGGKWKGGGMEGWEIGR